MPVSGGVTTRGGGWIAITGSASMPLVGGQFMTIVAYASITVVIV